MLKKAKCRKCIHCEYEDLDSYIIGCKILGRCNEKYSCKYFMTETEYKTILDYLKLQEVALKYSNLIKEK